MGVTWGSGRWRESGGLKVVGGDSIWMCEAEKKFFVMLACGQRNQGGTYQAIPSSCWVFFPFHKKGMTAKMFGHEIHCSI